MNTVNRLKTCLIALGLLGTTLPANAALVYTPINADTFTGTNFSDLSISTQLNSPSASFTHAVSADYGASGAAHADIGAGKTGAVASGVFESFAMFADVLTFASDTTVNYTLTLDGILSTIAGAGGISGQAFLGFYDVTGLESWIGTREDTDIDLINFRVEAPRLSSVSIRRSMEDTIIFAGPDFERTTERLSRDGTAHAVNISASDSFAVQAGREYGVYMFTLANSFTNSLADFGDTGSIDLFDTNGVSFTSASGAFIGSTPVVSVPAPASTGIFALGLLVLFLRSRKVRGYSWPA
ncbi:MAG: hypothetical protein AAF988_04745 [Pseudomonadota bacterium]